MKEMEAKTENRYEYRKPQEKRKQMIAPDLFEFAYAITVYSSQGSQWDNVTCLAELYGSNDFQKKVLYTMVTRAIQSVTLAL